VHRGQPGRGERVRRRDRQQVEIALQQVRQLLVIYTRTTCDPPVIPSSPVSANRTHALFVPS
jgi:hypothetical protein